MDMDSNQLPPSQRRTFLMIIVSLLGAAVGAAVGWPVWRFLAPTKGPGAEEKVTVERSALQVGGSHLFNFRGRPAIILEVAAGNYRAFSAVCPHLGCIIQWLPDKGEFLCPCHAGRFSAAGAVLSGPPPKPMESLPVSVEGDRIIVG